MVNLLTLVLLVLPGLTSCFSLTEDRRGIYQRIASAASRPPTLQPYLLDSYVCCNQPPTPIVPGYRVRNKLGLSLTKRGDRYAPLRKAVLEELAEMEGQASQEDLQMDDRIPVAELSDLPSRSEEPMFRPGSLLSRVLSAQSNGGSLGQDADTRPFEMMDYPEKRKFVRIPRSRSESTKPHEEKMKPSGDPAMEDQS